jgi:anti-sigma regulatory factor (Ser/Thr protein kinase)/ActR/RegA family two-component response regulator
VVQSEQPAGGEIPDAPKKQPTLIRTALEVDGDPEIDDMLQKILDPAIWRIQHAANNQAALELATRRRFDLIVTSTVSSGDEDIELLRQIRLVHPHVRLIILASESTPADVISSMREHALSYFSKPFSIDTLAEVIRLATEGPCWDDGIEVASATPDWLSLLVRCDVRVVDRLMQFLREISDVPNAEKQAVGTAFRELLLNAMEHGGKFDPKQFVEICYVRMRRMVMCRIKDPGEGFDLEELRHSALASPADDPMHHLSVRETQGLRPGGYGLLLAKHFVDEIKFSERGNEVILVKYLDRSAHGAGQ